MIGRTNAQTPSGKKVVTGSFTGNNSRYASISGLTFNPTNIAINVAPDSLPSTGYWLVFGSQIDDVCSGVYTGGSTGVLPGIAFNYSGGVLTIDSGYGGVWFYSEWTYHYILTE